MQNRRYGSLEELPARPDDDDTVTKLTEENIALRKKLKLLNYRLDEELEKAAKDKFKTPKLEIRSSTSADTSAIELKNAYKMIDRLKKSIKHYESNEGYNSSITKIIDLEDVIKKKEKEVEQLRVELKVQKKINKEQEKHIEELNEAAQKVTNPAQDRQQIHRLKEKVKKLAAENEQLQKVNREKHNKLVGLDLKARELERELQQQRPVPEQIEGHESLKDKYKDAVERLAKQSSLAIKYRERVTELTAQLQAVKQALAKKQRNPRSQLSPNQSSDRVRSKQNPNMSLIMQHIPSDQLPKRMRNERGVFI